jgi:hypothetical protein
MSRFESPKLTIDLEEVSKTEPVLELSGVELRDNAQKKLQEMQVGSPDPKALDELFTRFQEQGYTGPVDGVAADQALSKFLQDQGAISKPNDLTLTNTNNISSFKKASEEAGLKTNLAGLENATFYGHSRLDITERLSDRLTPETVSGRLLRENKNIPITFAAGDQFAYDSSTNEVRQGGEYAINDKVAATGENVIVVDPRSGEPLGEITGKPGYAAKSNLTGVATNEITETFAKERLESKSEGLGERVVGSQQYQTLNLGLSTSIGTAEAHVLAQGGRPGDVAAMNSQYLDKIDKQVAINGLNETLQNTDVYSQNNIKPEDFPILEKELNSLVQEYAKSHPIFSSMKANVNSKTGAVTVSLEEHTM